MKTYLVAGLLTGLLTTSTGATTIDFSAMRDGTALANQIPGLVFSLQGGPDSSGSPLVSSLWAPDGLVELNNTNSGGYPGANILYIAFASATRGISFDYNNYGPSTSFYTAYDADENVVSTGLLGDVDGYHFVQVAGSGIVDLKFDSNAGNKNWVFGLQSLSFGAVPEPASWTLMIGGFALVGATMRRRRSAVAA